MDFVRSPFRKMQLWIVEHFFLHKKVPVVMNHIIRYFQMLWFITTGTFFEEKCVQLVRVAFFRRDFFQNQSPADPTFGQFLISSWMEIFYKYDFIFQNIAVDSETESVWVDQRRKHERFQSEKPSCACERSRSSHQVIENTLKVGILLYLLACNRGSVF